MPYFEWFESPESDPDGTILRNLPKKSLDYQNINPYEDDTKIETTEIDKMMKEYKLDPKVPRVREKYPLNFKVVDSMIMN